MLEFFFYELPTTCPNGIPDELILSGQRINVTAENVHPFTLYATYELDTRSQNLIRETHVTIANVETIEDSEAPMPDTEGETLQLAFDFDTATAPTPAKPVQYDLTIETSRGKYLHKPLDAWRKDEDVEYAKFTPDGVFKCTDKGEPYPSDTQMFEYPKGKNGVMVRGKAETVIKLQLLTRLIGTSYKGIEGEKSTAHRPDLTRKLLKPLGNEYVHIRLNGTCEFKMGKFTARIPTETPTEVDTETPE